MKGSNTQTAAPSDDPLRLERLAIERLIETVQSVASEQNRAREGRVEEVLVEGPSRTDTDVLRGRTRRKTTVNFSGSAGPGDLVDVLIEGSTSTTLRGRLTTLVAVP